VLIDASGPRPEELKYTSELCIATYRSYFVTRVAFFIMHRRVQFSPTPSLNGVSHISLTVHESRPD